MSRIVLMIAYFPLSFGGMMMLGGVHSWKSAIAMSMIVASGMCLAFSGRKTSTESESK